MDAKGAVADLEARGGAFAALYVELARPDAVASLLASLDAPIEPVTQFDETYGRHKRWGNGLILIEDFVSAAEERGIMEGILAEDGWHSDRSKRQSVSLPFELVPSI